MALSLLVQKLKNRSSLSNQGGQALVEYVLVLVVSVALVMALAAQVFTPFRDFLKAYMGDYIACLLETGELPSLGNESTKELLEDQGCNAKFAAASLANGRPPNGANPAAAQQNQNQKKDGSSGSEGSSVGPAGGGNVGSTGNNLLISSMKKKTATEVASAPSKVTEIPLAGEGGSSFYNRKNSYSEDARRPLDKTTYVGIAGLTDEEKKKQERKEDSKRAIATGENFAPPPKKIPVKKPEPKPDVVADESPMTFGNFFRFLLIAAIIIALVMVLGSQALKIAKSQEK